MYESGYYPTLSPKVFSKIWSFSIVMDEKPRYCFFLLFEKIFLNKRTPNVGVGVEKKKEDSHILVKVKLTQPFYRAIWHVWKS